MTAGLRLEWEDLEELFLFAPCGYLVTDLEGRIVRVNETFGSITGWIPEELVGRRFFHDLITTPSKIFYHTHLSPLLRMQRRVDEVALEILLPDSSPLPVLVNVSVSEKVGTGIMKIAIFKARDRRGYEKDLLSAQRRAETEAEQERVAREAAERASRAKDEFLALISHELRTPLQAILSWTQILRRKAASNPEIEKGIFAIQQSARIQAGLINDLLDTGRIIAGKMRLEVEHVELSSVLDAAIDTSLPAAQAKGIKLFKVPDPAVYVLGDPGRLQQVFWNLISNAIKFTPCGGFVQIAVAKAGSHAEITVEDNGRGMSEDTIKHAFERYRQGASETTRKTDGLGLGLSLVKHLVEMHGGFVRAESEGEGKGSKFYVELPIANGREASTAGTKQETYAEKVDLEGLKILAIDDMEEERSALFTILSSAGADVLVLSSAIEAINRIEEYRPHLVISDIAMPDMDGYEFIRRVRMLGAGLNCVPAIALTALAEADHRTRALLAGYHLHLPKPVAPSELLAAVGSITGKIQRGEGRGIAL